MPGAAGDRQPAIDPTGSNAIPAVTGAPTPAPHADAATSTRPQPASASAAPRRTLPSGVVGRHGALTPDQEPEPFRSGRGAAQTPSTAQDFAQERVRGPAKAVPATRGLRRSVQTISFGRITPGPGHAERLERELVVTAKTPISTCRRISILSRKGGIGKTTTTLMLGHTFAMHRGDRVIALDANPDAGSLAYRVRRETDATVTQLMQAAERLHRYSDMRSFTSQSPSRLEVLASDDDPTISVALGENEYRQVLDVLEHHYNLILMDTGTGILDPATQGILRMSDQVVLCAAPGIDASRASSLTLDWLDEHGYRDLVKDAVVVINQVRKNGRRELQSVTQHFAKRCRAVVKVPWDPHLAEGLEVDFDQLRPDTRLAYLAAGAAVAKSFVLPSRRR
jgi:putative peptide zinc metalloprotease protein